MTGTTGTDTGLTAGTTYSYTVRACNSSRTASFAYLCLNGDCRSATRVNGRFERSVSGSLPITYAAGGASIASSCAP